jgi:tRNA pseudouridine38-40 synthase
MAHKYFVRLSYLGKGFHGWQRQKADDPTIEGTIQHALEIVLREPCPIVGCGRTDSGVHAKNYMLHFESETPINISIKKNLNAILDERIVIHEMFEVDSKAHARFSAVSRSYEYVVLSEKDPFRTDTAFLLHEYHRLNLTSLKQAADLILQYEDFSTFCKSDTDVATKICKIHESRWTESDVSLTYHITANRFLRGMVRLIVGMCLSVALDKVDIKEVKVALKNKSILAKNWSVPAHGLMLKDIKYPPELLQKKDD